MAIPPIGTNASYRNNKIYKSSEKPIAEADVMTERYSHLLRELLKLLFCGRTQDSLDSSNGADLLLRLLRALLLLLLSIL